MVLTGAELVSAAGVAKSIFDTARDFFTLKSEADKSAAILSIQRDALDLQQAYSAALKIIEKLEQEIVQLKDWETEKQRYEIYALGERAIAYAQKPNVENPKAPHWLCQPCFDSGHRAALQFSGISNPGGGSGLMASWQCGRCNSSVWTARHATPAEPNFD